MKPFLNDHFLLNSEVAQALYHGHAAPQPIIDYHNHLPPKDLAENRHFANLTEAWLEGDHYKWRAMRALGIDEAYVTGSASPKEKFLKWAETVPYTLRNPLYHWTHLELRRYFGIDELLSPKTAEHIYEETKGQLQQSAYSTRGLLEQMNVKVICTTDDPIDDLAYHAQLAKGWSAVKVLPTFRADKVLAIDQPGYTAYIEKLGQAAGVDINSLGTLKEALQQRHDHFAEHGCKLSDHGLNHIHAADCTEAEAGALFAKGLAGKDMTFAEAEAFRSYVLLHLAELDHSKGWTQQFHLGALRNVNVGGLEKLGPDTGFDSIGDFPQAEAMAKFFGELSRRGKLAKTILYNLDPAKNEVFATMVGNFQEGPDRGKMQFGSGWWFLDQKDGMEKQMNALSNMGLLSCFVGMLTDSRSFLSFPRHEYFRRILCNLLGEDVVKGELPHDMDLLGRMVSDICYGNAQRYFGF